jgi:hypothetical protein
MTMKIAIDSAGGTEAECSMSAGSDPSATLPPPDPVNPSEQRALAVQVMTTEHFTLQSARASATAESSSRSALFLTVLSAALVTLALAAQVANPEEVLLLALLALGVVFFLGLVTYLRVLENGIEDYLYVKEMNRIRHFYLEVAPETAPYFVLSHFDDPEGVHRSMGMEARRWESLLTSAGAVSVVNSVVGGVFSAVAVEVLTHPARTIPVATGIVFAVVTALGFFQHETARWRRAEETAPARFARSRKEPDA